LHLFHGGDADALHALPEGDHGQQVKEELVEVDGGTGTFDEQG